MANNSINADADVSAKLGIGPGRSSRHHIKKWLLWLMVAAVIAIPAIAVWSTRSKPATTEYLTEAVKRGDVTVTVTATGELASVTKVTVGTEISGVIDTLNVDFNDRVTVGQVLATINTDKLESQESQAEAALQSAEAKLLLAKATVFEATAELGRLKQVHELSGGKMPSQKDLDAQEATLKRAEADEASAAASVTQSRGSLNAIRIDIKKAVIKSPINGIVLNRAIEKGQTVAASFSTPTLFELAEDLTRMKLEVNVDEADVGNVRVGQDANFRVDAYADKTFKSKVTQVRNTATTTSGVVTYVTVLTVDNSELLLRPGMTATAEIIVSSVKNVVLVPNTALRYSPPEQAQKPADDEGGSVLNSLMPRPPDANRRADTGSTDGKQRVWVLKNGLPAGVPIVTGATDGKVTQVVSGDLPVGAAVIVDAITKK
jgi:HlyD family secretion protein